MEKLLNDVLIDNETATQNLIVHTIIKSVKNTVKEKGFAGISIPDDKLELMSIILAASTISTIPQTTRIAGVEKKLQEAFLQRIASQSKIARYTIVGGERVGHGFTRIKVIAKCDTEEEVKKICDAQYDECGGLIQVIDNSTGEEANIEGFEY